MSTHFLTFLLTCAVLLPATAAAQTKEAAAKATLADFDWLVGEWTGTGLGGRSDEAWSTPAGGAMLGMFRQVTDGKVLFYEILTLVERDGTVVLRLKHFHPDLVGWEEKAQVLEFPLLEATPTKKVFNGMTFAHESRDRFTVTLRLRDKATGEVREELFSYTRIQR